MKRLELSECELITMKCIWDSPEPITCQQIMEKLRTEYDLEYKDTIPAFKDKRNLVEGLKSNIGLKQTI